MSYSLLKNTYSRKNDYVEHFVVDTTSTSRIMSSLNLGNQETTELEFPAGSNKKDKILSPDGNWKLELNKDGLQLFGPSGFKTTLVSGGPTFKAYKMVIGTNGNVGLHGGPVEASVFNRLDGTYMWDTGPASLISEYWTLRVDNNGNIIREDINEGTYSEKLFTKIENNGALKNNLCFPATTIPGKYYQRTLLSDDCKWRIELNEQGFQLISKDKRRITVYKPLNTTSVMRLSLNENGQLLLYDGNNVVLKTKSFVSATYNAVVNKDNGSIDISQGTFLRYKTFATDINSYDTEGLRSDEFKFIISDNSNYLLSVDNEGLYILDISSSSIDNKTWIYKNTIDLTEMVRFYEHDNFLGNHIISKQVDSSSSLPGFNDKISSISIPDGIQVTVYEHEDYKGLSKVFTTSQASLSDFNDRISSYKVERVTASKTPVLIARLESYGEVKVYVNGTDTNRDCLWWAGTSEATTDNGPYKLSVTNAGKMLIMNKNNLGLIYKEVGPSSTISSDLNIAVRERARGDCFWTQSGQSFYVSQIDPRSPSSGKYPGKFIWFPSSKCMALLGDNNYSLDVIGGYSSYTKEDEKQVVFSTDGCVSGKRLDITWDLNGYIKEDRSNKYLNRVGDNGAGDQNIKLYTNPKTKWDIIRIDNSYKTIVPDSDCIMSPWSECDKMCKDGVQTRTKISSQSGQGKACTSENLTRNGFCGATECPVDCGVSDWSSWGSCSKDCGGGKRNRIKTIITASKFGGQVCPPPSSLFEEESCNTQACPSPVDCVVSDWGSWGSCSKDCGGGKRNRIKTIITASKFGGQACPPSSSLFEEESCNTQACPPVDCVVSDWGSWGSCSKDCGGGKRNRIKTITTASKFGGQCPPSSSLFEEESCNTQACPRPTPIKPSDTIKPPTPIKPVDNSKPSPSNIPEINPLIVDTQTNNKNIYIIAGVVVAVVLLLLILVVMMK